MRRVTLLLFCLVFVWPLAVSAASGQHKGAYLGAMPTEYPDWFKESFLDLKEDIAEAAAQGRRVVLLFHQDNCPYCNQLVERNLAQREIETLLRSRFDVIALNMWGDRPVTGLDGKSYTEKSFAAALRVQFTPTLLFFDEAGEVILRLNGYVPPARFKAALDWVAGHKEREIAFRDYVAALERAGVGEGRDLIRQPFFQDMTDLRRKGPKPRPLAVFFEQRDCPDCAVLHRRVLADAAVREAMAGFDVVQLDMWSNRPIVTPDGRRLTAREWARSLDVKFAPGIVLFDANGREVIRWESGFRVFHTAGMFDYVKSGAWLREPSFQRYLSARAEHIRESGRDVNIWRYADEP